MNSYQATQFRIWATKTLREFLIKGYVLDDDRLKQGLQIGYSLRSQFSLQDNADQKCYALRNKSEERQSTGRNVYAVRKQSEKMTGPEIGYAPRNQSFAGRFENVGEICYALRSESESCGFGIVDINTSTEHISPSCHFTPGRGVVVVEGRGVSNVHETFRIP